MRPGPRQEPGLNDLSIVDEWGPEKIVCVADPATGMRGVLVIDNTARGPGKGGTRMAPTVTVAEVARLARTMTWKWAAIDVFFGGAKAGLQADPGAPDREDVLRAFVRALSNEVPHEYVFGLDMGLTERDAVFIREELGTREASTGTPAELGGVPYDEWGVAGFGVAEATDAAAAFRGVDLSECRVVIQGFGAVGAAAARRFRELGATVVAVSSVRGVAYDPDGLDVDALLEARAAAGDGFVEQLAASSQQLPAGLELELATEVLVPAATANVIDERVANRISAPIVVEAANLPITQGAQAVLAARGTTVLPDFIANAGGALAAAHEMETRGSPFGSDRETILEAISAKLRPNAVKVLERSARNGTTTHVAARELAAKRVREAMQFRSGR